MKLYYSPGACSLADRIALYEGGLSSEFEKVDLRTKKTDVGADFRSINPKGYVPALVLDSGEIITENIAVLSWISDQAPELSVPGLLGRTKLLEAMAFISTEIHKAFKPFYNPTATDADKVQAGATIADKLEFIARTFRGPYLLGAHFSTADAYLFVMLRWALGSGCRSPSCSMHISSE